MMIFRERHFVFISLICSFILALIVYFIKFPFFKEVSFIIFVAGLTLGLTLYDFLFLDSESTSYAFAGKEALSHGYNPIAQDGIVYDPELYTISQIYGFFPNNRQRKPTPGSAGFMFTTYCGGRKSNKVEFYIYKDSDLYYYKFYFSNSDRFDYTKCKHMDIKKISKNKVFIALNQL